MTNSRLIQWPRAKYWDKAWNPIIGCKPCSPACEHCYAKAMADRIEAAWKREKTTIEADALAVGGLVEASHKRELFTKTRKNDNSGAAIYTNDNSGNAAALREALAEAQLVIEKCLSILNRIPDDCGYWGLVDETADELCYLREGPLKSALSAPARDCDVGTAEEQAQRFHHQCFEYHTGRCSPHCRTLPAKTQQECALKWAQMPYKAEEGGMGK